MLATIFTFYILITMVFIFIFHLYWMFGGLWPGKDKQDLLNKVVGKGDMPGLIAYIIVMFGFTFMILLPITLYYNINLGINNFEIYGLAFFAFIFFLRAFSMFIPNITNGVAEEFILLNKKIYAPLCLTLGLSYIYLFSIY